MYYATFRRVSLMYAHIRMRSARYLMLCHACACCTHVANAELCAMMPRSRQTKLGRRRLVDQRSEGARSSRFFVAMPAEPRHEAAASDVAGRTKRSMSARTYTGISASKAMPSLKCTCALSQASHASSRGSSWRCARGPRAYRRSPAVGLGLGPGELRH